MELLAIIGSCAILGLPILKEIRHQKRQAASGAHRINQMNERQFGEYLETMMRKLGYHVERPRHIGDGIADSSRPALIISTNGLKISVHTKHDGKTVDPQAIEAASTTQQQYGCSDTMIVCSSDISASTHTLAHNSNVILWSKNDVMKAALSVPHQPSQDMIREYSGDYFSKPQHSLA